MGIDGGELDETRARSQRRSWLTVGADCRRRAPRRPARSRVPRYAETPAAALARNVRDPRGRPAELQGADRRRQGRAALGDTQAAAGFFGRAEEVNAGNPLRIAGMGAALVATATPRAR